MSSPGVLAFSKSGASGFPLAVTVTPAVPASTESYCPCRPLSPAKSPAAYRPLLFSTTSALTWP